MKLVRAALLSTAACFAQPALAGDAVLYEPAPEWIEEAELAAPSAVSGPASLLRDWQYRLEDGVVTSYSDAAFRLDNPQALMQQGTISLDWLPDKGDLTVHRLEILRGGEVIDLLAQGVTFEVIRREQGLEQRLLDGQLTATLAVPGLRERDVLRLAYSTTTADQALGSEVQAAQYLPPAPWQVGEARVIVSWPADEEMFWSAEDPAGVAAPVERDGYNWLRVELPLAEPTPIPGDSPSRYQRPSVLRVGSFSGWEEVSATLTPHFEAAAVLPDGSPIAEQAEAIMARTSDPVERMALATRLVQDEVSYMLNGLDGGNYLPQSAEQTWAIRYGDCKAKSVLLLSLLRHMGIESEVVAVAAQGGDATPELLPLPLSFNHVIVHAVHEGQDYWLDGTSAATRLANLADVPPFFWALPLRPGGSDLIAMEQRDPAAPQMVAEITVDQSAGADFPALFTLEYSVSGPSGAPMRAMVDADDPEMLRQFASSFSNVGGVEGTSVSSVDVEYDAETAVASVVLRGVANSMFEWRDGRLETDVDNGIDPSGFNPDRARPSWRAIPVATPGPGRQVFTTRILLPDGGEGFTLSGMTDLEAEFANVWVSRHAAIEDGAMVARSETILRAGEIAPADLNAAKREARRLEGAAVELATPMDLTWRWEISEEERRRRAAPIVEAYTRAIAFADEEDYGPLQSRAMFLESAYMFEQALEDYTLLAEETPSPWAFFRRSAVLEALGRRDESIADLEAAYDLDPTNGTAFALARQLAYGGRTTEAEELLAVLPVGDADALSAADARATVSGLGGDSASGQALLAEQVADKPTSAETLNADCWYRGLFNVALDDALDLCTRAIERASNAAPPLDSRALVRFRLGLLDEALADLDAALEVWPGLAPSMYLRGVVRLQAGDSDGRQDIATALSMQPQLAEFYARHDIVPPQ